MTVQEVYEELNTQAELFDMDIDWETLTLVPKLKSDDKQWLINWKEKLANSDRPNTMGLEGVDRE